MNSANPALEELWYGVRRYLSIRSSGSPQFSPDDRRLAYLSDVTGLPQAWSVNLDGGSWPQQISLGQERVGFLRYAHKREMIACGVDSGGNEKFQIQIIEQGGERLGRVTDEPEVIHNWGDWSPDELSLCFSSNARSASFFDIYTQSLVDGSRELVHQNDGTNYPLCWSPDGSSILFVRAHAPFNDDLYVLRLADRSVELLTSHEGDASYTSATFDPTGRFVYCLSDEGREFPALAKIDVAGRSLSYLYTENRELESLSMSKDGSLLAFTVNDDGYSRLMLWKVGSDAPERVDVPRSVIGGLTWSNDGKKFAFSLSSSTMNQDVWLYETAVSSARRVTHSSTSGIPESSFVEAQHFTFRSFDGLEVPGFLFKPQSSEPAGAAMPLLLFLHGGPESQFRPGFNPLLQYFARLGFAVVAPNFRGSTGYGRRYTHLDDVHGRMDTVKDAIAAVAETQKRLQIDPRKIVAWGGSYGGFMVLVCLYSEPDLWAAGVDIVGISNFVTFLRQTGPWRRKLRIPEYGDPDRDNEFLERISPNNNAHLIKAPLFIIHGKNDPRVPLAEATQIMQTMTDLGREAHLMAYDDEGHGLVKLNNRIEAYSNALGFLMYRVTVSGRGPSPTPRRG